MPVIKSMPYVEYEFSDDELTIAAVFTELQTQYIETQLSMVVQEKSNLAYNPDTGESKDRYIFEHEYLRGQIEALQLLLSTSSELRNRQSDLLRRMSESQSDDAPSAAYGDELRNTLNS